MDASTWLWIVVALLVAIGTAGVVLPILPGVLLVLAGLVLGAWIDDFAYVGRGTLILLAGLAALTYAVDFAASALGARRAGADPRAMLGAALGGVVGLFFGLPGILIGPFAGAALGQLSSRGGLRRAGRVGLATWIGMLLGGAVKLGLVLTMLLIFALQRFA